MAATEFKLGEEIYRLDLPQRAAADPFDLPREPLQLLVASARDGGATIRIAGFDVQLSSFDALHEFLLQKLAAGLFEPDHPLLVEPQGSTRWEHAMEAFNAAVRAHFTNVTFAPPA